jgi:phosphoglycerate dehydrogenase-like enzyme
MRDRNSGSQATTGPGVIHVDSAGDPTTCQRILITLPLAQHDRQYLSLRLGGFDLRFAAPPSDDDLHWAQAIFGNVSPGARLIPHENIVRLHTPNVGLDSYAFLRQARPDLEITNSVGVMDDAVAEHGLALLLALTRCLPLLVDGKTARAWMQRSFSEACGATTIAGKSAHVLGYGRIARTLVTRLAGLGMKLTVYRRQPRGDDPLVERFLALGELAEHVRHADVLVSILPEYPETREIISERVLGAMQPTAYLINLGRGSAIDEPALVTALQSGRLAGAGLDVFQQEPLAETSPFWALPNLILSPHVAGRFDQEMRLHIEGFLRSLMTGATPAQQGSDGPRRGSGEGISPPSM